MIRGLIFVALAVLLIGGMGASQTCSVRCYFVSPDVDGVIEKAILDAVNGAKRSLDIAVFSFTDDHLGNAGVRAHRRGVSVRVILGQGQDTVLGGEHEKLVSAGIPTVVECTPGFFHHRFAVIDGNLVITGSYDWSDSADKDFFENVVFIHCPVLTAGPTVPEQYAKEFNRLWERLGRAEGAISREVDSYVGVNPVIIEEVDRVSGCIWLLNVSNAIVDLAGWSLSDLEGRYVFPKSTLVPPDDPFRVCIDTYNPTQDPTGFLPEPEHDEVFLLSPEGEIIDEVVW